MRSDTPETGGLQGSANEIVGRAGELREIDGLLARLVAGPAAVVLDGEAGIGKTALWRTGLDAARSLGLQTLSASPVEAETSFAFASLADLLAPVLPELLPQLPQPQRRALEIALLMRDDAGAPPQPHAIAAAFLAALRALAASGPVVLAIDDLQWLDAPSAEALRFALRRLGGEAVGMLFARRSAEPAAPPFGLERTAYAGRVALVPVGPLSPGALHGLIRARLGALPRPLLMRIHALAGGNPFFALEVARELRRAGTLPGPTDPLPVPRALRVLIGARIARLPDELRETLLFVAALSDPTVRAIEAALGADAIDRLHAADDLDLVEIRAGSVRFTHPLLASETYARAAPSRRRRVHRALAEVVTTAEERARQLALGTDAPDERVATALDEAAQACAARGAPQAAAELCERALRLTAADGQDALERRTIAAGRYHLAAGDTTRARAAFERAVELATEPGTRALADHGLALAAFRGSGFSESARLLEHALANASEPAHRCQIELDLVGALLQSDELPRAIPHAQRAAQLAHALGRADLLADALSYQAMTETLVGNGVPGELVKEGLSAAADAQRQGDRTTARDIPPELGLGAVLKWADDFSAARLVLERLRVALEESQAYASLPPTLFQLAELECWAGNWERAAVLSAQSVELAEQAEARTFQPLGVYSQALLQALRGDVDSARTAGSAGLEQCEQVANLRHRIRFHALLGLTELSAGDATAALPHLARADELSSAAGYAEPAVFRFAEDHVEAAVAVGDVEAAGALVERLERHARALGCPWCAVMAARGRGLVSAAGGDLQDAVARLEWALEQHERLQQPFEHGRTLLALGTVLRRARRRSAAREALGQAIRVFDGVGAALWTQRAREEERRLGGRRPAGTQLTAAERQIAELVAEGRSNKEVAARLFLTPKTVETQLSRIYAKLEVHSRTELAHRMTGGSQPSKL